VPGSQRTFLSALVFGLALAANPGLGAATGEGALQKPPAAETVGAAAKEGIIAFRLSTPEELRMLANRKTRATRGTGI
jgi:hypothetical protein